MSLFGLAFGSRAPVFALLGAELCAICAYMGLKGELFGWAMLSKPSIFNNYIGPFLFWACYHLLVSAVPMLIGAAPMELGPEVFAGIMVWRFLTYGGIVYISLVELEEKEHYLSLATGMMGYWANLGLAAVGLVMFLMSCDENFDRSLFWRPKSGKRHLRDCWNDKAVREKARKTKSDERWGLVAYTHPTYIPFDVVTPWLCEELVEKYEDKSVGRPEWMNSENNGKFIKCIAKIYKCKGSDKEEVDKALVKLFGRNGADLEEGVEGQLTFIPSKKSKRRIDKIQPE